METNSKDILPQSQRFNERQLEIHKMTIGNKYYQYHKALEASEKRVEELESELLELKNYSFDEYIEKLGDTHILLDACKEANEDYLNRINELESEIKRRDELIEYAQENYNLIIPDKYKY